jgi:AraC-like DNA-binding protein
LSESTVVSVQAPPLPYYLECGKAIYHVGQQHPNRNQLGIFDLIFVVSGALFMGEEDKHWTILPNQTLLLRPDCYHYALKPCEDETVFYWIHFHVAGNWKESSRSEISSAERTYPHINPFSISIPKSATVSDEKNIYRYMEWLMELSVETRSVAFWQEQQIFLELLNRLDQGSHAETSSQVMALAEKTEAYLKQNYQKDLTNESLSEAMHFHHNYIARCMKESYHCTPMEFLSAYRIDQAKLLLLKTEWPISRIADSVGYRYTPYFTNCFKKRVGLTPLRYRKQFSR